MIQKERWYMTLFFILNTCSITFCLWPIFYPYYASYLKHFDSSYNMKQLFSYFLYCYLGVTLSSSFMNFSIYLLGYKKSLYLNAIFLWLHCYFTVATTNIIIVSICVIVHGMLLQNTAILTILFFTEWYPEQASIYYSPSLSGIMVGSFIWTMIISHMINPDNEDLTWEVQEHYGISNYYSWEIAQRVPLAYYTHGTVVMLISIIVSFMIPESDKYKGLIHNWLNGVNDPVETIESEYISFKKDFSESVNSSILHTTSLNLSLQSHGTKNRVKNSIMQQENLLTNNQKHSEEIELTLIENNDQPISISGINETESKIRQYNILNDIFSKEFVLIFMISIIRNSQNAFLIDNFKIYGMKIVKSDHLLNQAYGISALFALFFRGAAGIICEKYGIVNSYKAALVTAVIIDLLYVTIIESYPSLFLVSVIIGRSLYNINCMINYLTLYTIYPTEKALKLSMIFDLAYFIAIIVMILSNEYLVKGLEFKKTYYFYLILDSFGLLLTIFLLPKILNKSNT